jgi:hypothetical protein
MQCCQAQHGLVCQAGKAAEVLISCNGQKCSFAAKSSGLLCFVAAPSNVLSAVKRYFERVQLQEGVLVMRVAAATQVARRMRYRTCLQHDIMTFEHVGGW